MTVSVEVQGLDFMFYQLKQMERATSTRILRATTRKAAKPMIATAKGLVPYAGVRGSYNLRDNIKLQLEPAKNRTSSVQYRLGVANAAAGPEDRPGVQVAGGLSGSKKAPNYGLVIEGGRRLAGTRGKRKASKTKVGAQPFLLPAMEQNADQFINIFARELSKSIAREAKKAAQQK